MRIDWVMLIAAVAVFVVALVLQSFVQMRVTATNVRRYWNESADDSNKLVRQDVSGIIVAIGISNALLAAILATGIIIQRAHFGRGQRPIQKKKRRPAEANRHLPVNSRPLIELLTIGGHDRQQ